MQGIQLPQPKGLLPGMMAGPPQFPAIAPPRPAPAPASRGGGPSGISRELDRWQRQKEREEEVAWRERLENTRKEERRENIDRETEWAEKKFDVDLLKSEAAQMDAARHTKMGLQMQRMGTLDALSIEESAQVLNTALDQLSETLGDPRATPEEAKEARRRVEWARNNRRAIVHGVRERDLPTVYANVVRSGPGGQLVTEQVPITDAPTTREELVEKVPVAGREAAELEGAHLAVVMTDLIAGGAPGAQRRLEESYVSRNIERDFSRLLTQVRMAGDQTADSIIEIAGYLGLPITSKEGALTAQLSGSRAHRLADTFFQELSEKGAADIQKATPLEFWAKTLPEDSRAVHIFARMAGGQELPDMSPAEAEAYVMYLKAMGGHVLNVLTQKAIPAGSKYEQPLKLNKEQLTAFRSFATELLRTIDDRETAVATSPAGRAASRSRGFVNQMTREFALLQETPDLDERTATWEDQEARARDFLSLYSRDLVEGDIGQLERMMSTTGVATPETQEALQSVLQPVQAPLPPSPTPPQEFSDLWEEHFNSEYYGVAD
jgi:hypothetical protein